MINVVHLTSVHPRDDTRIFLKECRSLIEAGYKVSLVVADGKGSTKQEQVSIYDVGVLKGRLSRAMFTTFKVLLKAIRLNADIYHLHDPELIHIGIFLKIFNKKVIFDLHEDVAQQIQGKFYINPIMKIVLAKFFSVYEKNVLKHFDALIFATPTISEKYADLRSPMETINNYPIKDEFIVCQDSWSLKSNTVCYVGGISKIRGIIEIVGAFSKDRVAARLKLAGVFEDQKLEAQILSAASANKIDFLGFQDREQLIDVFNESVCGLVIFLPLPNHMRAQPNKIFEYMAAGIPVIVSDFPLWRNIIETSQCGVCVDPADADAIADAVMFFINNRPEAEKMGRNGRNAIANRYNWDIEKKKLVQLYARVSERA